MSTQASSSSFNYNESMMRLQKQGDLSGFEKSRAAFAHKSSHSISAKPSTVVSMGGQVKMSKKRGADIPRAKTKSISQMPVQNSRPFSPPKTVN